MAIKVKATERNVSFDKTTEKWAYVLTTELYNRLSGAKVMEEAAMRSGISKGSISAAWDAIGDVIKAWATEGHSVAIPGLGTMRFGLRSTSVSDVSANLITSRRVIFTPTPDIKQQLKQTKVNIICYDRLGNVVKQVTSDDDGTIDPDEDTTFILTVSSANATMGSTTGGGSYTMGATATLTATAKSGYHFTQWNDGNANASRTVTVSANASYTAQF